MEEVKKEEQSLSLFLYTDEAGNPLYRVKADDKGNREISVRDKRRHYKEGTPAKWVPYNLQKIVSSEQHKPIFICGDETDADFLNAMGWVATCGIPNGLGGHFEPDWARYFAGHWCIVVKSNNVGCKEIAAQAISVLNPVAVYITAWVPADMKATETIAECLTRREMDYEKVLSEVAAEMQTQIDAENLAAAVNDVGPGIDHGDAWEPTAVNDSSETTYDCRWRPFPLDLLPFEASAYIREASRMLSCDPGFFVLGVLTTLGGAVGNSRVIWLNDDWMEPSVFWGCLVADSSSMKTPASNKAVQPLKDLAFAFELENERKKDVYKDAMKMYKASSFSGKNGSPDTHEPVEPTAPRFRRVHVDDCTVESLAPIMRDNPKGLILEQDELRGWFGSFMRYKAAASSGSDEPFWLQAFNASEKRVDRKGGDGTSVFVPRCAISVYGNTQDEILVDVFQPAFFKSGFVARILFALPPNTESVFVRGGMSLETKTDYQELFRRLYFIDGDRCFDKDYAPSAVRLTADGLDAWEEFHRSWSRRQWLSLGSIGKALAKLKAYAARFSLLFALCDFVTGKTASEEVNASHVERAFGVVSWFSDEACRVYHMLTKPAHEIEKDKIIEWVKKHGGVVTAHKLYASNPSRWGKTENCYKPLDTLAEAGQLERVEVPSGPRGGRPGILYRTPTRAN